MDRLRILLTNEPRAYREVLAAALRALRPRAWVLAVEPAELDTAVGRYAPHLVVCSRLTERARTGPLSWALLYPEGAARAELSLGGQRTTAPDVELEGLLALVDDTARLAGLS